MVASENAPPARARVARSAAVPPAGPRAPLPWLAPGVFVGTLAPLGLMVWEGAAGRLGANPIAEAENLLGLTALVILVASLACTPARRIFGWAWPARIRRELGLF